MEIRQHPKDIFVDGWNFQSCDIGSISRLRKRQRDAVELLSSKPRRVDNSKVPERLEVDIQDS